MSDLSNLGNFKNLIFNFKSKVIENKSTGSPKEANCVDKETFLRDNPSLNNSIFEAFDFNEDGYIEEDEYKMIRLFDQDGDGELSEQELEQYHKNALNSALFFARRNVDKWFTMDINRDGVLSNVEDEMAKYRMREECTDMEHIKDSALSNEELAIKYNMTEENNVGWTLEKHMESWRNTIIEDTKYQFGVELSEKDIILIQKEMIKQLNTWLFKTGDNATGDAPLYNSLNVTAYTRLMTDNQTISCCGGDIVPPPMTESKDGCTEAFRPMTLSADQQIEYIREAQELEKQLKLEIEQGIITEEQADERWNEFDKKYSIVNTSEEVKNRLAWAMFPIIPKEELAQNPESTVWENMTDEQYAKYHEQYMTMRNMTASDFRELLRPENKAKREEFEKNSIMTVGQIVQYINMVEEVTGKPWDSDDWQINQGDFHKIGLMINGTDKDEELLQGKTRADISENRQNLLHYLEEKGWLYETFSSNNNAFKIENAFEESICFKGLTIQEHEAVDNNEIDIDIIHQKHAKKIIADLRKHFNYDEKYPADKYEIEIIYHDGIYSRDYYEMTVYKKI